jgi:hypothetical protein
VFRQTTEATCAVVLTVSATRGELLQAFSCSGAVSEPTMFAKEPSSE